MNHTILDYLFEEVTANLTISILSSVAAIAGFAITVYQVRELRITLDKLTHELEESRSPSP